MPPPLPYFKVNICPFSFPHFASKLFAYLWSFRWSNYIVTLPRYFALRLPQLNIPTPLPPQTDWTRVTVNVACFIFKSLKRIHSLPVRFKLISKFKKRCFKNQMSVIWSWTYFYNLHWNNYLYFKSLITLHLRGDDHDGIVTHDRSREFRMHMKNPAQIGSGCIRFNDLKIKQATFVDILVQFVWGGPGRNI
jgi:hypothetical protein